MLNQQGFTLVELIMVIIILGILSAVAIPKFVDMQAEAKESSADGVFGAASSAAAINHAAKLVGKPTTLISNGSSLLNAMDGLPAGWAYDDSGGIGKVGLCVDPDDSNAIGTEEICDTATYFVRVAAAETATSKAVIVKSW